MSDTLDAIDELAAKWKTARAERQARRHLDPADFEALAETGFLRLIVPVDHGGLWRSFPESAPVVIEAVRRIARGDQSVGLVAAMHPGVMMLWTGLEDAPEPFTDLWADQRARVFKSAVDGGFWGTLTSEPGSGGDLAKTKATAVPIKGDSGHFSLRGQKHFGSGSEVASYMITTAKPTGADGPLGFVMDLRDEPWDGSGGLEITHRWDGMGMKATQSHGVMLKGIAGEPFAWPGSLTVSGPASGALGLSTYAAVIVAIIDEMMEEAALQLGGRVLRSYEDVEYTAARVDHWMITQAMDGLVRRLVTTDPTVSVIDAMYAKIGIAQMAEALASRVSHAVGGKAFSARSPFASWFEDVRALGYLRPPWALAFDQLSTSARAHSGNNNDHDDSQDEQ